MGKKKKVTTVNYNNSPNPIVFKMINHFSDLLKLGYTNDTWTEASMVLRDISRNVSQETMNDLGDLWSQAYVATDLVEIDRRVEKVISTLNPQ